MKVLDAGYVVLVEAWGSDERIIEAARMSTGKGFQGWHSDEKLLAYLYNHKHATPFEMAGMVIEVKAPIFVFREWHRHRTQSYNEMSARYIPLPDENYMPLLGNMVERSEAAAATKNRQAVGRYSRMRASANLRNWLAFLTLRLAPNAQWEIRQYAEAVGALIAGHFPRTWALFAKEQANGD